jgi:hypothetical protein
MQDVQLSKVFEHVKHGDEQFTQRFTWFNVPAGQVWVHIPL